MLPQIIVLMVRSIIRSKDGLIMKKIVNLILFTIYINNTIEESDERRGLFSRRGPSCMKPILGQGSLGFVCILPQLPRPMLSAGRSKQEALRPSYLT